MTEPRAETTLLEVVQRIKDGTFYEDYDWASGPALRALDNALMQNYNVGDLILMETIRAMKTERDKIVAYLMAESSESRALFKRDMKSEMALLYAQHSLYYEQAAMFIKRGQHYSKRPTHPLLDDAEK